MEAMTLAANRSIFIFVKRFSLKDMRRSFLKGIFVGI
jgi:hypothetical protein